MKIFSVMFMVILITLMSSVLLSSCLVSPAPQSEPTPESTPEPESVPPTPSNGLPTAPTPAEPENKLTVGWLANGVIEIDEYLGEMAYGDFEIHWRSDEQNIYIGMKAKTSGWVSVAFQPGSRMKNADMVLGFIKNGETTVLDLFSTGAFGPHSPDEELGGTQNILEYGGSEDSEFTIVEFKRALNTGDDYDIVVSFGKNKIIWAYGSSDDVTQKHARRGYGEIVINS